MSDITQRIDAVTKIGEDRIKAGGIQPAPKSVKIEITGRCNLRCKFCAVRTREHQPSVDMNFFLFQKITEDMRLSGVEEIGLFYLGESFMAPELLKKCTSWLKADLEFPYVFLTSNAVRATADVVEELMQLGIDSLKWSVNCHSAEQFSDLTGGSRGQYFAVFKNIKDAWTLRNDGGYKTMLSASSILYDPPQQKLMDAVPWGPSGKFVYNPNLESAYGRPEPQLHHPTHFDVHSNNLYRCDPDLRHPAPEQKRPDHRPGAAHDEYAWLR